MRFQTKILLLVCLAILGSLSVLVFSSFRITEHNIRLVTRDGSENIRRLAANADIVPTLQKAFDRDGFIGLRDVLKSETNGDKVFIFAEDGALVAANSRDFDHAIVNLTDSGFRITGQEGRLELRIEKADHPAIWANGERAATIVLLPNFGLEPPASGVIASINNTLLIAGLTIAFAAIGLTYVLLKHTLAPLKNIEESLAKIKNGDDNILVPVYRNDEIGKIAAGLNELLQAQRKTQKIRQDILSDLAHDLRTPLTGLRCQVETLIDGLKPANHENLQALLSSLMQLQNLYSDLEEIAYAQQPDFKLDIKAVNLPALIRSIILEYETRSPHINYRVNVMESDIHIAADEDRLRRVVRNILDNAVTATRGSGVVDVLCSKSKKTAAVTIQDSGEGISLDDAPFIFERFFRANKERTPNTGNYGLGLAIASHLLGRMGGQIKLLNAGQKEAQFEIELPLAKDR